MDDLISRELAMSFPFANGRYDHVNANEHFIFGCETYKEWLEQLPSAEPQIIHCRDCDRRDEYGCCTYWKYLTTGVFPVAVDDDEFCNHARRRTDGR